MNYPESGNQTVGGIINRCHHIRSRHEAATKNCNRVVGIRIIHYLCSYTPSGNATIPDNDKTTRWRTTRQYKAL